MELCIGQSGKHECSYMDYYRVAGDRRDSQNLIIDTFCRLRVVSAHCIIGTEKNPDAGMLLNYNGNDYSQGYGQIKEASIALTKYDNLQPY